MGMWQSLSWGRFICGFIASALHKVKPHIWNPLSPDPPFPPPTTTTTMFFVRVRCYGACTW